MNSLIFAFHVLIVVAVPAAFGWVVLRRVVREMDGLMLVPASVTLGVSALMCLINEARYFLPMGEAVWFCYKALIAATLGLTLATTPARSHPRLAGIARGWIRLGVVSLGTILVSFYFGYPASQGVMNDGWWFHYPAATLIQTQEHFPLAHPFALDQPLYYHFGPDLLAATWSFLLDISVPAGFAINVALLAPVSFLMAFALTLRLSRNWVSGVLAGCLVVAGGNLRFLGLFGADFGSTASLMQVFNSQTVEGLLELIFTPSHALGIPLSLTIFALMRHFFVRPTPGLAAVIGLALGSLSMVGEWYFLPLTAVFTVVATANALRRIRRHLSISLAVAPFVIAAAVCVFNNSYLSGLFGHFWMRYTNIEAVSVSRQIDQALRQSSSTPQGGIDQALRQSSSTPEILSGTDIEIHQPPWEVPKLVPLKLNTTHLGMVPSWESAASDGDTFIPILSRAFFSEALPVLIVGLAFAGIMAWRHRRPIVVTMALISIGMALPPVVLDWGYRSTDFLRFFTGALTFAGIFAGWLAGDLLVRRSVREKALGGALAVACLINPVALAMIGLRSDTLAIANRVASTAESLSSLVPGSSPALAPALDERAHLPSLSSLVSGSSPASLRATEAENEARRRAAFESLATRTGNYLYPLTKGQARVVVLAPSEQIPKTEYFPEWMRMATLSRILIPVGWHWHESLYASLYREAATELTSQALAGLGAEWVIESNLFQPQLPATLSNQLTDRRRFVRATTLREGTYYMTLYRVAQP
jgi:hypothetical protein